MSVVLDKRGLPPGWRWANHNEEKCKACEGTGHKLGHPRWVCFDCHGWGVELSTRMYR